MKLHDLMEQLHSLEEQKEKDVYIYYWDHQNKRYISEDFTIEITRNKNTVYIVQEGQPECMMGGHDDGCMCNLGFIPRRR